MAKCNECSEGREMQLLLEIRELECEKAAFLDEASGRMVEFPGKNLYVLQCEGCKAIRVTNRRPM